MSRICKSFREWFSSSNSSSSKCSKQDKACKWSWLRKTKNSSHSNQDWLEILQSSPVWGDFLDWLVFMHDGAYRELILGDGKKVDTERVIGELRAYLTMYERLKDWSKEKDV